MPYNKKEKEHFSGGMSFVTIIIIIFVMIFLGTLFYWSVPAMLGVHRNKYINDSVSAFVELTATPNLGF